MLATHVFVNGRNPGNFPATRGREKGHTLLSLDGEPAAAVARREFKTSENNMEGGIELLVEFGSQPAAPDGTLPYFQARTAILFPDRVRILAPEELRKGQWLQFCQTDLEWAAKAAHDLNRRLPSPKRDEGYLLIAPPGLKGTLPLSDPTEILTSPRRETPLLGVNANIQIATKAHLGPLLLGQSLALARLGSP